MHPKAFIFDLFGIKLVLLPYTTFIILAFVVMSIGSLWMFRRDGMSYRSALIILLGGGAAALIGARLLNGILNWDVYSQDPWRWTTFHAMGFSLYGGVILGIGATYVLSKVRGLDPWRVGDLSAPFLGIGIALVRVGCYLRGCCFGEVTTAQWGVKFPLFGQAHLHQLGGDDALLLFVATVHPTQVYELVGALAASAIAWKFLHAKMPVGVGVLAFAFTFTLVRLINYFFRVIPDSNITPWFFYPILYVVLLVIAIVLLRNRFRGKGNV